MTVSAQVERLISVGGSALGIPEPEVSGLPSDLWELLCLKNGFLAFESALHVLPGEPVSGGTMSVQRWNGSGLWRSSYDGMADGLFFFAEDVFGGQFAFDSLGVLSFDPETGDCDRIADDLEGWAGRVLDDYRLLTGFPAAHSWQESHGQLAVGARLMPKRPFVLGGEFVAENLYALDAAKGMRMRGELATQIRDLPEGAEVSFRVIE
jgi:hypothetical protein